MESLAVKSRKFLRASVLDDVIAVKLGGRLAMQLIAAADVGGYPTTWLLDCWKHAAAAA